MSNKEDKIQAFGRLLDIMDELREKCPWDKKQTMESLRHLTIEETYELADAVLKKNMNEIKTELGDVMMHLTFYAKIASETNDFDIKDVLDTVCDKLIYRHPHIYGNVKVKDEKEVSENWEKLKLQKNGKSVLSGVPNALPAMVKAIRIQDKARGVGFDWDDKAQVWEKVKEELRELKYEVDNKTDKIEDELGDVLFSIINYARFIDANAENALERTNQKFIKRFQYLEENSAADGKKLGEMTLEEMDVYWNRAKNELTN